MRINDPEHAMMIKYGEKVEKKYEQIKEMKKNKVPKWKRESNKLREIINSNKNVEPVMGTGNMVKVKEEEESDDGLIKCNMCSRKYNQNAYDKHLNMCTKRNQETQHQAKYGNKNAGPKNSFNKAKNYGVGLVKK